MIVAGYVVMGGQRGYHPHRVVLSVLLSCKAKGHVVPKSVKSNVHLSNVEYYMKCGHLRGAQVREPEKAGVGVKNAQERRRLSRRGGWGCIDIIFMNYVRAWMTDHTPPSGNASLSLLTDC